MAKKPLNNRQAPERKNLDELEILRQIIQANPRLKEKVLHRIQEIKEQGDDGAKLPPVRR